MSKLRDVDLADRMQLLQASAWLVYGVGSILVFLEFMFFNPGSLVGWLVLLAFDGLVVFGLAWLITRVSQWTGETMASALLAGGNLQSAPAHSGMESLVARGFYLEATEAYRAWLAEHPDDHLARLKLAEVHRVHLRESAPAERLYQEVRSAQGAAREHEMMASNLLIELYRDTGRNDRVMVELARFAARFRGTQAGARAGEALRKLKQEMPRES